MTRLNPNPVCVDFGEDPDEILTSVHGPFFRIRRKMLREELEAHKQKNGKPMFLDAGCGSGPYIRSLQEFGAVVALDLNARRLQIAAKRHTSKLPVFFIEGSIDHLPFKPAAFHGVLCLAVLEHVPHDFKAIKELFRVLGPTGILLVNVPATRYSVMQRRISRIWSLMRHGIVEKTRVRQLEMECGKAHVREGYSDDDLKKLLQEAGFVDIRVSRFFGPLSEAFFLILEGLFFRLFQGEVGRENRRSRHLKQDRIIVQIAKVLIFPLSFFARGLDLLLPRRLYFEQFAVAHKPISPSR